MRTKHPPPAAVDEITDFVPFVPAFDLFEARATQLSEEEAVGIALALVALGSDSNESYAVEWKLAARREGIGQTGIR